MIFADKIIQLRKKNGWSQEELAEQMNVSRQSVSKWESAQSIPDIEKIIRLSELFGVSIDYLLKDEKGDVEYTGCESDEGGEMRRVTMEEASDFIKVKGETAKRIAFGVFLCILSPICLFILSGASEEYGLSENIACGLGLVILLGMIAAAVSIFISSGKRTSDYEFLEKEIFETEYGVTGMVNERKKQYRDTYNRSLTVGSVLCICSLIPIFAGIIISESNDMLMIIMLSCMFLIAGAGVMILTKSCIIWESFAKLLQEGDYTKNKKRSASSAASTIYWLGFTALYVIYSLITNNWDTSWIIWVAAGILYPVFLSVCRLFSQK